MFDPRHFSKSPLLDQAIKNVAEEVDEAMARRKKAAKPKSKGAMDLKQRKTFGKGPKTKGNSGKSGK